MDHRTYKDFFDIYRKQMEHEDSLVNMRITWHCVLQAAMLTAFLQLGNVQSLDVILLTKLRWLISLAGLALTAYTFLAVQAATSASNALANKCSEVLQEWRKWNEKDAETEKIAEALIPTYPRGGGSESIHTRGFIFGPWGFLLFGFAWLIIAFIFLLR